MVKVLQPGFYSSIQDNGRVGFQQYGVPISGAMDRYSAQLANYIIGNSSEDAVLEMTMVGPKLQFSTNTTIAITGADMQPKINNIPVKLNSAIAVNSGDILSLTKAINGFRAYLAVAGGFLTELRLNSRSMYANITSNSAVKKNNVLKITEVITTIPAKNAMVKVNEQHLKQEIIEVFEGPEFAMLQDVQKDLLFTKSHSISKLNNRMAYQLEDPLKNSLQPIITSLVLPGTIQLTPSGSLIILMRDCQTTGGYPRILQLSEASINRLAQKSTGDKVRFELIKQTT